MNALSMNALSMNALSMNALSMNALSMNGLEIDGNGLEETPEGRHLLKYVVRCALDSGTTLTAQVDGVVYEFPGLLGLAPQWIDGAIDGSGEELISACLLSHVNAFGISISISARHPLLPVSPEEESRFGFYEGGFYGDLFAVPPVMLACAGDPGPDFSVEYPDHDTSTGDRLLRRCTDVDTNDTVCGFELVGSCSDVCDSSDGGSYSGCWSQPQHNGSRYDDVVSIWLLDADDPASSWPVEYDRVYGP